VESESTSLPKRRDKETLKWSKDRRTHFHHLARVDKGSFEVGKMARKPHLLHHLFPFQFGAYSVLEEGERGAQLGRKVVER